jgi:hypothetical protein
MSAPELSAEEWEIHDRFDGADYPAEVTEARDRELIARHLRSAASALNITDWPAYLLAAADGHADGTSWYRP